MLKVNVLGLCAGNVLSMDVTAGGSVMFMVGTILNKDLIRELRLIIGESGVVSIFDLQELRKLMQKDSTFALKYHEYIYEMLKDALYEINEGVSTDKFYRYVLEVNKVLYERCSFLYNLALLGSFHAYTLSHSVSVAVYSWLLSTKYGCSETERLDILMGGLLHDVGKLQVSIEILDKPDKLTDIEFGMIKRHPLWGSELFDYNDSIRGIILKHHEKLDGSGYPNGTTDVDLLSRMVTVSDIYSALTSERSYHQACSTEAGIEILRKEVLHGKLDKELVGCFIGLLKEYSKYGSTVVR